MKENIQVKNFICKCGKARLLSVIDPTGKSFSKEQKKTHRELLYAGCDVATISLEEARLTEMCFECKL
jgi:hypothetical protein